MAGAGRWGGMELVPGALDRLSGASSNTGSGSRRDPTPPSRQTPSYRGDSHSGSGLTVFHGRSGSDGLDPRGLPTRPPGGGRPLSGGSRSGSRGDVNASVSPNPAQPHSQEMVLPNESGHHGSGGGSGGGGVDLIQRCVIIQRGEKGYGLTVSGDNPVYVQDVKSHGAAARAGVQPGDRIMKVNGTLVTSSNHVEVVRMIKSGSLVSLTLLGRPPGSGTGHRGHPAPSGRQTDPNANLNPHQQQPHHHHHHTHYPAEITEPKPIEAEQELAWAKVKNLKKYLDKALAEREQLSHEYKKHPNDKCYGKILENQRLIEQLHSQVQDACRKAGIALPGEGEAPSTVNAPAAATGGAKVPYPSDGTRASIAYPSSHENPQENHDIHLKMTSIGGGVGGGGGSGADSGAMTQALMFGGGRFHDDDDDEDTGCDVALFNYGELPTPTPSENFYPSSPDSRQLFPGASDVTSPISPGVGLNPTAPPFPASALTNPTSAFPVVGPATVYVDNDIINMEDDDLQEDIASESAGPFSDFGKLKQYPAHLAVFLRYLIDNSDPSCLFFFLITESYASSSSNLKDLKRWAYEISSTFLFEGSPLCLNVDEASVKRVNDVVERKVEKEADLREIFDEIRIIAQNNITDALSGFRQKRQIGMGGFYGEHLLKERNSKLKEPARQLKIVESLLLKFLKDWTNHFTDWEDSSDRNQALAFCLVTFFKLYGLEKVSKQSDLEKIPVFISKQNHRGLNRLTGGGPAAHRRKILGHSLMPAMYTMKTDCEQCNSLLWGIGTLQGFQCQHCNQNFHKSCLNSIEKDCQTDKNKSGLFFGKKDTKKKLDKKEENERTRRSTSPSQPDRKEPSPADDEEKDNVEPLPGEGLTGDSKSANVARSNSMKHNEEGKKGLRAEKNKSIQRSKSDPKVDQEELREQILKQTTKLESPASASQSSLESSGSTTVPHAADSDSEASKETSTSHSIVSDPIPTAPLAPDDEFPVGDELPRLEDIISQEHLKKMNKKEKEKQKVINELFHTEMTHVRHLRVLETLFFLPMRNEHIMANQDLNALFNNLSEVINIHTDMQHAMNSRRQESEDGLVHSVSDILLERFKGEKGDKFRETCANFLKNQAHALEMLRMKTRKDMKLAKFLQEKEEDPRCRRLQLKDLLPEEMQRMVKYPILLESLAKHLEKDSEEHKGIVEAVKESKEILSYINMATRDCMNRHTLQEIQKKLDTAPWERSGHPLAILYKDMDLTVRKLIHTGSLKWRVNRTRIIELQVLLFKDIILLLQKQDDKYVLKCQGTSPSIHSPIILVKHVLLREVATDRRAFFLVSIDPEHKGGGDGEKPTGGSHTSLYELVAISVDERRRWQEYIESAVKNAGGGGEVPRSYAGLASGTPVVVPTNLTKNSSGVTIIKPSSPEEEQQPASEPRRDVNGGSLGSLSTSTLTGDAENATVGGVDAGGARNSMDLTPVGPGDLVQPGEVTVHKINAPVAVVSRTGEQLSSPLEQMESKDAQIRKLLSEKQRILAGVLRIPAEEFPAAAAAAAADLTPDGHRQPKNQREMALAAWHQVERLTLLLSDHQTLAVASASSPPPPLPSSHLSSASATGHAPGHASKSASLGRNAYLVPDGNSRNRHTSSPAIASSDAAAEEAPSSPQQQPATHTPPLAADAVPAHKLLPLISSLQENLSSLLSVMEISPSSPEGGASHRRMDRADSIPPYPPPPPPDDASTSPSPSPPATSSAPVAPPTPFAGGFRDGAAKPSGVAPPPLDASSSSSSPSPIPICPPPPKELLLPTSGGDDADDDEDDDEDVKTSHRKSSSSSAGAPSRAPSRPDGRGAARRNGSTSSHESPGRVGSGGDPKRSSLSPASSGARRPSGRSPARSSLSPPASGKGSHPSSPRPSPKPGSSPLPQRGAVANNRLVMEEGEETFVDDDDDGNVDGVGFGFSASSSSSSSRASFPASALDGGLPFATPQLEEEDKDDDEFDSNTTYV